MLKVCERPILFADYLLNCRRILRATPLQISTGAPFGACQNAYTTFDRTVQLGLVLMKWDSSTPIESADINLVVSYHSEKLS